MKPGLLPTLALASSLPAIDAISLRKRQDGPAKVMHFDVARRSVEDPISHDRRRLRRRGDTLNLGLNNDQTLYYLTASLGTPGQEVQLYIDTGSSDLWVNNPSSRLCTSRGDPCSETGTYDPDKSSTVKLVSQDFNISYADGSGASGDYVTDTLRLKGQTVDDMQFGIGLDSSTPTNILGIGYESNEAQSANEGEGTYKNLPAMLVSNGVISSNAYSLWLNDLSASTGSLLFGGVDKDKYEGDLVTMPVQQIASGYYEFFVTLTGVQLGSDDLGKDMALAVLLDSGSTLTYLPDDIVSDIYKNLDVAYDQSSGTGYVPCDVANQDTDMKISFSSPSSISIPMNELVINLGENNMQFSDGTSACLFGIAPAQGSTSVLGDTFLRSAYVVYDLDNNEISMAQTKYNVSTSNIVEIGDGKESVPSAADANNDVPAESGLPDQQEQGRAGDIDSSGGLSLPTGSLDGGDDDDDAAGSLSPPVYMATLIASLSLVVFGGLLL